MPEEYLMVIQRARENLIDFEIATNSNYEPNWHHEFIAKELEHIERFGDRDYKILIITVPPRHGKEIASDTLIPTPDGFKKHGELQVGDFVFGSDHKPTEVIAVIPQEERVDLEVTISDGSSVIVHSNHEWTVYDRKKNTRNNLVTLETRELQQDLWIGTRGVRGSRARWQLLDSQVVQFSEKKTLFDPYTLGVWLGDGSTNEPRITMSYEDLEEVLFYIPYRPKKIHFHKNTGVSSAYFSSNKHGVAGEFQIGLEKIGVWGNKHIPREYLFNSESVRREILAGLIDTDGCVTADGRVRFINTNKNLIDDVAILVRSLGYRICITNQEPSLSSSGIQGKKRVFTISFSINEFKQIAKLKRKSKKLILATKRRRAIVSIEKVKSKKGECIQVSNKDGIYLATEAFIPTHNSQQGSIDFPAWYLGRNPTKEIITASYSADLAQDFGAKTREKMDSEQYKLIFPEVPLREDERARGRWRTKQGGSYISVGVGGAITGRGTNVFLIDDPIKNREEAESQVYRDKTWEWFTSTAYTRLEPKGVVVLILTRWHLDDLAGRILANKDLAKRTKVIKFTAIDEKGEALWPERYDLKNLEETKLAIGPYDWASLYQGNPILTENQEFKPEWMKRISEKELEMRSTNKYLTIDTALSKRDQADYCGFCDNEVDNENFWNIRAWRAKLNADELVDTLFTLQDRRKYVSIGIEKTAYLDGLRPFLDAEQRKRGKFLPIIELKHGGVQKEIRIRSLIPRYAAGSIRHVEGQCAALEEEQFNFPFGKNDDVLDATAYQSQMAQALFFEEDNDLSRKTKTQRGR